jgi:predicted HTH transcriptional regulator
VVEKAARWAYALETSRAPEDPRILRSDWLPWLRTKSWYQHQRSLADNYHASVENLLQPRQNRKNFFLKLITPGIDPSSGYQKLCEFLHHGVIKTVLTTNFDHLLPDATRLLRRPRHVTLIETPSDYTVFSTSPDYPQIIYLHGSVEHYTDHNILQEVQKLDENLVSMLAPLLRDHPLIVIGYRGGEPSVMEHLLLDNAQKNNNYRHGIYWCVPESEHAIPPLVVNLHQTIQRNLHLVHIEGFDELFTKTLWPQFEQSHTASPTPAVQTKAVAYPTFDLQPVHDRSMDDLHWSTLSDRLLRYCENLAIRPPVAPDRQWLMDEALRQNLATRLSDGTMKPTVAGYLLFGETPHPSIPAKVTLQLSNDQEWLKAILSKEAAGSLDPLSDSDGEMTRRTITGNLWRQLDQITDALALVNSPFRLKGDLSQDVTPYPPLALKEIIVNALVHRDYAKDQQIRIEVTPTSVRISNPGGLIDEVRRQLDGGSIQAQIVQGRRGIKGYRNPVIADLFYGGGAMDKTGSGLSDAYKATTHVGGTMAFGPTEQNVEFQVMLTCRPEAIDAVTKTAQPRAQTSRYAANILEMLELPDTIWHADTEAKTDEDVRSLIDGPSLPFILFNDRLFSYHNLHQRENPLRKAISEGTVETLGRREFLALSGGPTHLIWLLNECLYQHLMHRGLLVDRKRKRAYFPRTEDGAREIAYQARLRKAKRTVVKPRMSRASDKIQYWEHKALTFRFETFGETLGLVIIPGYVFTWDGWRGLLAAERVSRLSTRRAARDYNTTVHNDLYFWVWLLSGGEGDSFTLDLDPLLPDVDYTKENSSPEPGLSNFDLINPIFTLSSVFPTTTISEAESGFETGEGSEEEPEEDLVALDEELTALAEKAAHEKADPAVGGSDAT